MIENGKIYKYTNLINGMVYIGQTKQTLEQRDYKHQLQFFIEPLKNMEEIIFP